MFDDLHPDEAERRRRAPEGTRPLSDREVPIGSATTTIAGAVHAWLDGDATESVARRSSGPHEVEFWTRMDGELARRRRLRTPAGLEARIMAAIPEHAPRLVTPWWRRELLVTPGQAALVLGAVMALAAAATALILR